jgi:hypothetical protein
MTYPPYSGALIFSSASMLRDGRKNAVEVNDKGRERQIKEAAPEYPKKVLPAPIASVLLSTFVLGSSRQLSRRADSFAIRLVRCRIWAA